VGSRRRLPTGKVPVPLLREVLAELPVPPAELRLGPRIGEDACAIEVSDGILVVATDPITLTSADVGRFSVLVNANDVAVMGIRPRWFLADVLLPTGSTEADVRDLFRTMQRALSGIGATLVGGHTEVTDAVTRPIVVGQMLGSARDGTFVTTGGARPGEVLVQVGPVPVEGAAVLARLPDERLAALEPSLTAAARSALDEPGISIVEPALLAAELGVTAMHDPTEGGMAAALHEVADASQTRIRVDLDAVVWFEPGRALCRALDADPLATLASGALLAAFARERADAALATLSERGYRVAAIGAFEPGSGVVDMQGREIPWPERDEVARFVSA
jgi:hydrogenase maturation factor